MKRAGDVHDRHGSKSGNTSDHSGQPQGVRVHSLMAEWRPRSVTLDRSMLNHARITIPSRSGNLHVICSEVSFISCATVWDNMALEVSTKKDEYQEDEYHLSDSVKEVLHSMWPNRRQGKRKTIIRWISPRAGKGSLLDFAHRALPSLLLWRGNYGWNFQVRCTI
jgi:hypothetical protein